MAKKKEEIIEGLAIKDTSQNKVGLYFNEDNVPIELFSSGCTLLDLIMGGGFASRRIIDIYGGTQTGKSALAYKICNTFLDKFPNGIIKFADTEGGIEKGYIEALGLDLSKIEFLKDEKNSPIYTFEQFGNVIQTILENKPIEIPCLLIIDSLDALDSEDDKDRDMVNTKGGYAGGRRANLIGELLRKAKQLETRNVTTFIIGQERVVLGATIYMKQTRRAGGKVREHFPSQVLFFDDKEKIKTKVGEVERIIGEWVKVTCEKTRFTTSFKKCDFPFIFGWGIDNEWANLQWLKDIKKLEQFKFEGITQGLGDIVMRRIAREVRQNPEAKQSLDKLVIELWNEIDKQFEYT